MHSKHSNNNTQGLDPVFNSRENLVPTDSRCSFVFLRPSVGGADSVLGER